MPHPSVTTLILILTLSGTHAVAGPDQWDEDLEDWTPESSADEEYTPVMDTDTPGGDTDIDPDSDEPETDEPILDTTPPSAAEIAGEIGGFHCSAAPMVPALWLPLVGLACLVVGRRRR